MDNGIAMEVFQQLNMLLTEIDARRKGSGGYGYLHRDMDLPAVESLTVKEWWVDGQRHREGGLPAIEYANGNKRWFFNGEEIEVPREKGLA